MSEQVNTTSSGSRARTHVVERCRQDPQLGEAVVALLDVCEQMNYEDPGAGREFLKALDNMSKNRRMAGKIKDEQREANPQAEIQTLRDVYDQLADIHGCIIQLRDHEDERVKGLASMM